jgi:hypothetical protein
MPDTQLLRIRIKPGKTARVVDFIRSLLKRRSEALEALKREGTLVESFFLERQEQGDYLYYYVKAESLRRAYAVHMDAQDPLTSEIREFVEDTWATISSPEPLLDLDLIPRETSPTQSGPLARLPVQAPE